MLRYHYLCFIKCLWWYVYLVSWLQKWGYTGVVNTLPSLLHYQPIKLQYFQQPPQLLVGVLECLNCHHHAFIQWNMLLKSTPLPAEMGSIGLRDYTLALFTTYSVCYKHKLSMQIARHAKLMQYWQFWVMCMSSSSSE